ncbi:MAG: NAD+ synthase, partial [Alphaproteobacteria bacterium]|nr:NAD+ synthase [Alphaproteobacteria bacterium]
MTSPPVTGKYVFMTNALHITLAQINPIVGDLAYNLQKIQQVRDSAPDHTDLVIFPETVLCGYPAEDLILKPIFIDAVADILKTLTTESAAGGPALLLTAPSRINDTVMNTAHLVVNGKLIASVTKSNLPNYGVFDEKRVFTAGPLPAPVTFRGHKLGIMICEDMWSPAAAAHLRDQGATLLIVPNASPFEKNKQDKRINVARARVSETNLPLIYVNQCGGQDDLVFDGGSFILNEKGGVV